MTNAEIRMILTLIDVNTTDKRGDEYRYQEEGAWDGCRYIDTNGIKSLKRGIISCFDTEKTYENYKQALKSDRKSS